MLVFVLECIVLCPFEFCNYLDKEERVGCFAFIILWMSCYLKCHVTLPHGAVGRSVVCDCGICIPDHTHILFNKPSGF